MIPQFGTDGITMGAFQKSGEKPFAEFLKVPWQFWTQQTATQITGHAKTATDLAQYGAIQRVLSKK